MGKEYEMASATKKLTSAQIERRRRLLLIFSELKEELQKLEEALQKKRANQLLVAKEIKQIDAELREIDLMLKPLEAFYTKLKQHDTTHDCHLGRIVGSDVVGNMYFTRTGKKNLSAFLESDYREAEEAFGKKRMGVPFVLQEIYKRYQRFDHPADDQSGAAFKPHASLPITDC